MSNSKEYFIEKMLTMYTTDTVLEVLGVDESNQSSELVRMFAEAQVLETALSDTPLSVYQKGEGNIYGVVVASTDYLDIVWI